MVFLNTYTYWEGQYVHEHLLTPTPPECYTQGFEIRGNAATPFPERNRQPQKYLFTIYFGGPGSPDNASLIPGLFKKINLKKTTGKIL